MAATIPARVRTPLAVGAALVLISLNLRLVLAAVPPVLDDIRDSLGLSTTGAGLLTTAPVLCFAFAAPLAPWLARRVGQELLLMGCMAALFAGVVIRIVETVPTLFLGTVVLGVAIAVANVLMPSVIKRRFENPGTMMGLYTMSLSASAAISAGLTVPVEHALGGSWSWAIAVWGLFALVAMVAFAPDVRGAGREPSEGAEHAVSLWRDGLAWLVTLSFGLQSLMFYAMLTWTPDILRDAGMSSVTAGAMLSIAMLCGIPPALLIPMFAARLRDQRALAFVAPLFWGAGLAGLLVAPATLPALWMVLMGIGQGTGIAFALTLVVLRSGDAGRAAALSGMAQGVGYGLAAIGPVLVGALHDLSGGWELPIAALLVTCAGLLAASLGGARDRLVGGTTR